MKIRVIRRDWLEGEKTIPAVRIYAGAHAVTIPLDRARKVVDDIHDRCDEYESQLREAARNE